MKPTLAILSLMVVGWMVVGTLYSGALPGAKQQTTCSQGGGVVKVVAAENFWGSLVSQLGGTHVNVLSIVTDPNADPHEYESNAATAQAVADACLVIVNGAGYDSWAQLLTSATANQYQTVLNVQTLLGLPADSNPHFWYSPYYVNETVKGMYHDLVAIDPSDASFYRSQYAALNASLGTYNTKIHEITQRFAGAKVGATEDIFVYLANATKLDLISPPVFMQAVAEGNDPPAPSVVEFEKQVTNRNLTLLVFNQQTVTPLTDSIKALAGQNGIPIVGITETVQPPNAQFQAWMSSELDAILAALAGGAGA
jgi:zinc/manganese transport system substrate-binding protein